MAQDQTSLFNLALSAVGTRSRVSLPTENSREAEVCRLWYDTARDTVLRAAHWPSAKAAAVPALMATRDFNVAWAAGAPQPNWLYAYALPADFLYPRWVSNYAPFEMGFHNGAPALLTNVTNALFVYTTKNIIPQYWDADLYQSVALALAALIALPVHGKVSRAKIAFELANESLLRARVRLANEDNQLFESIPDWLSVRGVGQPSAVNAYIYPVGPLLTPLISP